MVQSDWLTHVEEGFGVPTDRAAIAQGFVVDNMPRSTVWKPLPPPSRLQTIYGFKVNPAFRGDHAT
jgi:hypothetical protein